MTIQPQFQSSYIPYENSIQSKTDKAYHKSICWYCGFHIYHNNYKIPDYFSRITHISCMREHRIHGNNKKKTRSRYREEYKRGFLD